MPILGDFAVKYTAHALDLGVSTDDLYQALVDTAENTVSANLYSVHHAHHAHSHLTGIEVSFHFVI